MPDDLPLNRAKVDAFLADLECTELDDLLVALNLVTTLCLVQPTEHSFAARDVVHIESRWIRMAAEFTQGGFVASLGDGRRAYLEYLVGEPANQENVRITVQVLGTNQIYPELGEGDATVDWTDEVELLNELLKTVLG